VLSRRIVTERAVERLVVEDSCAARDFVFADERGEPLQGTVVYKYHWRPMLARARLARDPAA